MGIDLRQDPYVLPRADKEPLLCEELWTLTESHRERCEPYRRILDALPALGTGTGRSLTDLPMLPVQLFKTLELRSVPRDEVFKTLTSSGTTGQALSRIYLDKDTAKAQTRALATILKSYIGGKRLPMLLIDSASVIKDRTSYSARGAGLLGLSVFGRDHTYALDDDRQLRWEAIDEFLERHQGEPLLLFGFTFMVWQELYLACKRAGRKLDLSGATLIHSGGWKKLVELQIDDATFKSSLAEQFGIERVHNFYGMVEQVGSIFVQCESGRLHAPSFSEVIVRDPHTLEPLPQGATGIIQVISALPHSYPGHSLLTEDIGRINGCDDCDCGRLGTHFSIDGRLSMAELRGCSDAHAYDG